MRKKKENIRLTSAKSGEREIDEALETEREERYEEIAGEMATDDVGPGYTNEPAFEHSIEGNEGPLSGESNTPPDKKQIVGESKRVTRRRHRAKRLPQGRHAAARSSKKL
jgi:hypothetical protein